MFFVFGPSGQMFRGGPENLAHIAGVQRVGRLQALRTRAVEGPAVEIPWADGELRATAQVARPVPTGEAAAAYAQVAQGSEPVRKPLTLVREVMTAQVLTVTPDMRVNDAWQTLAEHGVSQAPVVNADQRVVGLLVRADMAPLDLLPEPGAIQAAIDLARRAVGAVMISPVPTVAADTALRRVAAVLLATGLPGLPVTTEAGLLEGFVSRSDLLRAVAADPPLDLWAGPAGGL